MKKIFIIPGFRHSSNQKEYLDVADIFKKKGFEPMIVNIKWKYTVFNQWVEQFWKSFKQEKDDEIVLLGFSYGAMIALVAATKIKPTNLVLCSLSPYFSEDIPKLKRSWLQSIGKKRVNDFSDLNFEEISKQVKCKTYLLIGEKESKKYPGLELRVLEAHKEIKSKLIRMTNVDHNIGQKEYLETIDKLFS